MSNLKIVSGWCGWPLGRQDLLLGVDPRFVRVSVQEHRHRVQGDIVVVHVQGGRGIVANNGDLDGYAGVGVRVLYGDVLDLVTGVEQVDYLRTVGYVQVGEVVHVVVGVEDQGVRVVGPQVYEDVLDEHALE